MWKVYRIETDEILKAGFVTEEEAKEWMDRHNLDEDDETITMDEMDSDEEEQWLEAHEEETYLPIEKDGEEEDEEEGATAASIALLSPSSSFTPFSFGGVERKTRSVLLVLEGWGP